MVVIEHNLDVIKTADWLIDMGPEGGSGGGLVVAEGTPEDVARVEASHTGHFLRELLIDKGGKQPALGKTPAIGKPVVAPAAKRPRTRTPKAK